MPYWLSNIHCQIVSAASTGIAQASSRPAWVRMRTQRDTLVRRTATAMPIAIVIAALARQNTTERTTTVQRYESVTSAR